MDAQRLVFRNIHAPQTCDKCGKTAMDYQGVGEYKCAECGFVMYDDFGKVRNYLEAHRGAIASEVSQATGVSIDTIRQFLKEERLEITAGSGVMLACEICKAPIRSGRYCEDCLRTISRKKAAENAAGHKPNLQGFGTHRTGESGAKRFTR